MSLIRTKKESLFKKSLGKKMNKRGQLTIFIIVAIIIVVIILILLYPRIKSAVSGPSPVDSIKKCAEDATKQALAKLELQGGTLTPENYILYQDNKIEYSCYTNEYYKPCVMQKPFLKQDIEKEVIGAIEPKVKECFNSLKSQLESRGSYVSVGEIKVDASLIPNSMLININAPTVIKKQTAVSFNQFKVNVKTPLYDLVMLASSISNYEARYGDSDTLTFMLYYPDIRIEKKVQSEGSTIYILTNKNSNEKFMFAARSIAWPPGYLGGKTR